MRRIHPLEPSGSWIADKRRPGTAGQQAALPYNSVAARAASFHPQSRPSVIQDKMNPGRPFDALYGEASQRFLQCALAAEAQHCCPPPHHPMAPPGFALVTDLWIAPCLTSLQPPSCHTLAGQCCPGLAVPLSNLLLPSLKRPAAAFADTTYSVAGARDHYREQNRNAGVVLERLPEYSNMFSKLPHHPSTTYRYGSILLGMQTVQSPTRAHAVIIPVAPSAANDGCPFLPVPSAAFLRPMKGEE